MNKLKELREERKLYQAEIATLLGISQGTYSNWENGKTEPDIKNLNKLADFYNVTVDYLIGYEPTEHNMSVVNNALKFAQDIGVTDEKIQNMTSRKKDKIKKLIEIAIDET